MSAQKNNRNKYLRVRLSAGELKRIQDRCSRSTSRKMSEYVRKIMLDKPVTVYIRNQSLDDFMSQMASLLKDLNAIGNNYNQVVKRLYSLQHLDEIKIWLKLNETSKQLLLNKVSEIKTKINQINDQWLQ